MVEVKISNRSVPDGPISNQFNINLREIAKGDASKEVPLCVACLPDNPRVQLRYISDGLHIVQFKFENEKEANEFVNALEQICPVYRQDKPQKQEKECKESTEPSDATDPVNNYIKTAFGLNPHEFGQKILEIMSEPSFELLVHAIERQMDGKAMW